jgi:hypothetical protein
MRSTNEKSKQEIYRYYNKTRAKEKTYIRESVKSTGVRAFFYYIMNQ